MIKPGTLCIVLEPDEARDRIEYLKTTSHIAEVISGPHPPGICTDGSLARMLRTYYVCDIDGRKFDVGAHLLRPIDGPDIAVDVDTARELETA